MDPVDRHNIPDPMGWLGLLATDARMRILDQCDVLSFDQGETIYRADDPPGGLYASISGRLDLHWTHFPENQTLWYVVGPGWWIGVLAALGGERRRSDVIAARKCLVLRLPLTKISQIQRLDPTFSSSLLTMSMAANRASINMVEFLSISNTTSRVATCLVSLSYTGSGWNGHIPVTQCELAKILKVSRGRVLGALHQLEDEELIRLSYGEITILESERMRTKWVEEASLN